MNRHAWEVQYATMLYLANRSFADFAEWFFTSKDLYPAYRAEWFERWHTGYVALFSHMDFNNQVRFAEKVMETYGAEAADRYERTIRFYASKEG